MKIYLSHSKHLMDYESELYKPILDSQIAKSHDFILPHDKTTKPYNSRDMIKNKQIDLIVAEVSYPATGQGIELGWAEEYKIPVLCIYKKGSDISGSLEVVTDDFIEYENKNDFIDKLETHLNKYEK